MSEYATVFATWSESWTKMNKHRQVPCCIIIKTIQITSAIFFLEKMKKIAPSNKWVCNLHYTPG